MADMKLTVFTIGHSNISFEEFVERLENQGIETLVDVRSAPVSRYCPQFNHEQLDALLPDHSISYEFMGDRLGGRPKRMDCLKPEGNPDYEKMAEDEDFIDGLEILKRMAGRSVVCIMCSEEDPAKCHRSKLVAARLTMLGVRVLHILADGTLETEGENAKRRFNKEDKQLELFYKKHDAGKVTR